MFIFKRQTKISILIYVIYHLLLQFALICESSLLHKVNTADILRNCLDYLPSYAPVRHCSSKPETGTANWSKVIYWIFISHLENIDQTCETALTINSERGKIYNH